MESDQLKIFCDKCGREAWPHMLRCPDRETGQCPYKVVAGVSPVGCLFGLVVFLFWLGGITLSRKLLALAGIHLPSYDQQPVWGVSFTVVCGFALVALSAVGKKTTLFNPETGATWTGWHLFGKLLATRITEHHSPLALDLTASESLALPASLALLEDETLEPVYQALQGRGKRPIGRNALDPMPASDGKRFFTAALAGLIAAGAVEIRKARFKLSRWAHLSGRSFRGRDGVQYTVHPGRADFEERGALEGRIMAAVRAHQTQPPNPDFPTGISVNTLVWSCFDHSEDDPRRWLARVAQDEAISLGMGSRLRGAKAMKASPSPGSVAGKLLAFAGSFMEFFKLNPEYAEEIGKERALVEEMLEKLIRSAPEFCDHLSGEIEEGFRQRQASSD